MESHEYIHTPEESVPQNRIWKEERGGGHLTCPYTVDSIARAEDSVTRAEGVTSTRQRGRTLNSDIGCVTLGTDHDVDLLGTYHARYCSHRQRTNSKRERTNHKSACEDARQFSVARYSNLGMHVAAVPWAARLR